MASYALLIFTAIAASCYGEEAYVTESLKTHNELRAKHHAPALKLDTALCELAEKCAKHYARKGVIDHSCPDKKHFGENLAYTMDSSDAPSKEVAAKQGIEDWYGEVKGYKYDNPADKSNGETGHFTQLVWKSSKSFCIASHQDSDKKSTYTCALYDPMGNDMSDNYKLYKENVLEP